MAIGGGYLFDYAPGEAIFKFPYHTLQRGQALSKRVIFNIPWHGGPSWLQPVIDSVREARRRAFFWELARRHEPSR